MAEECCMFDGVKFYVEFGFLNGYNYVSCTPMLYVCPFIAWMNDFFSRRTQKPKIMHVYYIMLEAGTLRS